MIPINLQKNPQPNSPITSNGDNGWIPTPDNGFVHLDRTSAKPRIYTKSSRVIERKLNHST